MLDHREKLLLVKSLFQKRFRGLWSRLLLWMYTRGTLEFDLDFRFRYGKSSRSLERARLNNNLMRARDYSQN